MTDCLVSLQISSKTSSHTSLKPLFTGRSKFFEYYKNASNQKIRNGLNIYQKHLCSIQFKSPFL